MDCNINGTGLNCQILRDFLCCSQAFPGLFLLQERISVIGSRNKSLLDRAHADPAEQIYFCAGLVVRTRPASTAKWLLADHRTRGLVIDIKVTRGIAQLLRRHLNGETIL